MKKKYLTLLSCLLLISCQTESNTKNVDLYRNVLSFADDTFNIMHLTDIHWCYGTVIEESKNYLQDLYNNAKKSEGHIDLVTITGDLFLDANQYIVNELFDLLSSWDVPIAVVYGNHDKEGTWSTSWMNKKVSTTKNFIAKIVDNDDVYGDTNYFIDINNGDALSWRIYMIDSNSLATKNVIKYKYDKIHEDQVDWMKRVHETNTNNAPSLGFFHIPPNELFAALDKAKEDPSTVIFGEQQEKCCAAAEESSFFSEAKKIGMKGMFYGHDHDNDIALEYEDVVMGYGVKTGKELYSYTDENGLDHSGYSICSLKKDQSWSLKHVYMQYDNHDKITVSNIWRSK